MNHKLIKIQYIIYIMEKKINERLTFRNMVNNKKKKKIKILVKLKEELNNNKINKTKNIICPICKENIRIKIEDYKIKLYECKNDHIIYNILFEEYEDTQFIDTSKIICEICKEKNKGNSYDNLFYRCNQCKLNICQLCKLNHNKNHNIINYELKDYICDMHNEGFVKYCAKCKKDICLFCEYAHKNHDIIFYNNIIEDIKKLKNDKNEYKKEFDIFNNNIDNIIYKLKRVKENMNIFQYI